MQPTKTVLVSAPSRLHFGLLGFGAGHERQYGGAGVMIDRPRVIVRIAPSEEFVVRYGPQARRIAFLAQMWARRKLKRRMPAVRVDLESMVPTHVGLGSGTQLALAIASGLNHCYGLPTEAPDSLARLVDRGQRSAVGSHGFSHGGLIFEEGRTSRELLAPLAHRLRFPDHWRFLLVRPQPGEGLSGPREGEAFAELPPVPQDRTQRLHQIVASDLLPAVESVNFAAFSEAVFEFGRISGESFAKIQGGCFANGPVTAAIDGLRRMGLRGVGQSSWGPTVFCVCESEASANEWRQRMIEQPVAASVDILIARPDNHGALIRVTDKP